MARSLIGVCGKLCSACAVFIATAASDNVKKAQLADELSAELDRKLKETDISCWGCRSSDRNCLDPNCHFRKCSKEKGLEFCYRCTQYPCAKLHEFYQKHSAAKENLRKICKMGVEAFNAERAKLESEDV